MSKLLEKQFKRQRWHFKSYDEEKVRKFSKKFQVDELLAKILVTRGFEEYTDEAVREFIDQPKSLLFGDLCVSTEKDMEKSTERIRQAIENNEPVMVNGDPDADGITGTAVMTTGLRSMGIKTFYDFPVRAREGHGLHPRIIDDADKLGCKLIFTVDCGIGNVKPVDYANSKGIDVIICDHHILGKEIPNALSIVNPKLMESNHPYQALSGSGVALKFILYVAKRLGYDYSQDIIEYMVALAALGTISDRMTLKEPVNRYIVRHGIEVINDTEMPGLKALKLISTRGRDIVKSRDVSRTILPRLNAPGRIGDREKGIPDSGLVVDLLLSGTPDQEEKSLDEILDEYNMVLSKVDRYKRYDQEVIKEASIVDDVNDKRKFLTNKIEDEIDNYIQLNEDLEDAKIVTIEGEDWNPGVIGIDADRLKDRFLRPAMILTNHSDGDYVRGSCRSIPNINMYQILVEVSEKFQTKNNQPLFQVKVSSEEGDQLINSFGGHAQACGFTLHRRNLDVFLELLKLEVNGLPDSDFEFSYDVIDTLTFDQLNNDLIETMDVLLPYGQEFDYPIFYLKDCWISGVRPFGNRHQEVRFPHMNAIIEGVSEDMTPSGNKKIKVVGFGLYEKYMHLRKQQEDPVFDIIFSVDYYDPPGRKKKYREMQLNILDISVNASDQIDR